MYRYKKGDTCPFCGQVIQTDDKKILQLISCAAAAAGIPAPEDRTAVWHCKYPTCDYNLLFFADSVCCADCSRRENCDEGACLLCPTECGMSEVRK